MNTQPGQSTTDSELADIAVVGLAVMGQNLVLNMNDHGYKVAAYNRTTKTMQEFIDGPAKNTRVVGVSSFEEMVGLLSTPRKIMLMVRAGGAVDATIEALIPLLDAGDIIIDGGNSNFEDSQRRTAYLKDKSLRFIGTGVSGGEEGARNGPSIMPGGDPEAWPHVKDILQSISAHVGDNIPCCDWVGRGGAGHFVKMVHNGIEYGDMQLICEAYHFMQAALGLDNSAMSEVFAGWDRGELDSYLIEITTEILKFREGDQYVVDSIMDRAGQKGTGKWTGINALQLGVPLTLIGEAVFSRNLSALKEERVAAEAVLKGPDPISHNDSDTAYVDQWTALLGEALLASKIVSYAQGYMLMRAASEEYDWDLQYGSIAMMWRGGCIIRSAFLGNIKDAFDRDPGLANLLIDPYFAEKVMQAQYAWRKVVAKGVELGIPLPAMSSALAFYDGYRHGRLPANLLQAQRDYFGAHTYERVDKPAGDRFHTDWTGEGGDVSSSSYTA